VVQRVRDCTVRVENRLIGEIHSGLLAYLGVEKGDSLKDLDYMLKKLVGLRVFKDDKGKMNLSVRDINKSIMVISQFTICADTRKGNRPSYNNAEEPDKAKFFYLNFIEKLKNSGLHVESGKFQEQMDVAYINDGPVTILLDSKKIF
jgi:D-tyrosyl-tRNA(Tyr) deacylase